MSQGTRGTMTGAHLGDRGACRRRSCSATAAPREGGRRRGHGDGRHHPRPQRSFFRNFCQRTWDVNGMTFLCSWTRPNVSKAALARSAGRDSTASPSAVAMKKVTAKEAMETTMEKRWPICMVSGVDGVSRVRRVRWCGFRSWQSASRAPAVAPLKNDPVPSSRKIG